MGKRILRLFLHYGIITYGGLAVVLFAACRVFLEPLWTDLLAGFSGGSTAVSESFARQSLLLFCFLLWVYLYGCSLRDTVYRDATGRSYANDRAKFQRGYFYLLHFFRLADKNRIRPASLPEEDWKGAEGIILGHCGKNLMKRPSAGVGNLALFGRPGDGKTTSQIIPSALRFDGSVLCIDIKGDVLSWTKENRRIKIFAPNDPAASCHFDPFDGLRQLSADDRRAFIENTGFSLVPDEDGENAAFFVDGARDFWNGITHYMLAQDAGTTFIDVVNAILTGSAIPWVEKVAASDIYEAKIYLASYLGTNEKNLNGQYKKLCDSLRPLTSGALQNLLCAHDDAITPQLLDEGYDIYIEIPQEKMKIFAPVTSLVIQNFMAYFMGRPDSSSGVSLRPVLFLLDEFPQLHLDYENVLLPGLATLRSKKVSFFLAMQSIASLERRYGEPGMREIMDNCGYISVMSAQDPKSRRFFQELIGKRQTLKVSTSEGSGGRSKQASKSVQEAEEYVYRPEDFGSLQERVVVITGGKYIEADQCRCYE